MGALWYRIVDVYVLSAFIFNLVLFNEAPNKLSPVTRLLISRGDVACSLSALALTATLFAIFFVASLIPSKPLSGYYQTFYHDLPSGFNTVGKTCS
jgi:hypothetical protein